MENADARLEKTLLCWALTGSLAEKGLGEKFALGRKLNEYLRDEKLSKDDERMNLTKLFILAAAPAEDPYAITKLLMSGKYSALLSGANCFDKIWWFNKEVSDDSLNKLTLLALLASKPAKTADIFKLYKTLCAAKTKAAYKCENLLKEFAPKESTKKKTVKKSAKKPTRAIKQTKKA